MKCLLFVYEKTEAEEELSDRLNLYDYFVRLMGFPICMSMYFEYFEFSEHNEETRRQIPQIEHLTPGFIVCIMLIIF